MLVEAFTSKFIDLEIVRRHQRMETFGQLRDEHVGFHPIHVVPVDTVVPDEMSVCERLGHQTGQMSQSAFRVGVSEQYNRSRVGCGRRVLEDYVRTDVKTGY